MKLLKMWVPFGSDSKRKNFLFLLVSKDILTRKAFSQSSNLIFGLYTYTPVLLFAVCLKRFFFTRAVTKRLVLILYKFNIAWSLRVWYSVLPHLIFTLGCTMYRPIYTHCLTRIVFIVRTFNIWVLAGDQSHMIKALINALHCGMSNLIKSSI